MEAGPTKTQEETKNEENDNESIAIS